MFSYIVYFYFKYTGSFSNLRYSNTAKGTLATLSSDNPNFECHIRLNEIEEVKMLCIKKALPNGLENTLYVTRFIGKDGTTLLSSILNGEKNIENW